jgi:drug/metabolite transporter (DMT)-like permease
VNPARVFVLTALAMIAFAANSLLCRVALKLTTIDAASFTSIRIASGAITLWLILQVRSGNIRNAGNWISAFALFAYAAGFSFAYISLSAATGALLLFAAVQATMITFGLTKGESMRAAQWFGFVLALGGLVFLLSPGLSASPVGGSILMLSAGVAWGVYSLRGKGSGDPTSATAGNFLRAVPITALMSFVLLSHVHVDLAGIGSAIASGAITSGVGYVIWYAALPHLKATTAATVQLSAPVLAALGGIMFLSEAMTLRFVIAAIAVLGGIALVVLSRSKSPRARAPVDRNL